MNKASTQTRSQYIEHILHNLPHKPGVYKMKNDQGQIIYVGKAKDLKHRVSSYFQNDNNKEMRTRKMIEQIADIEYIEVGTELEALFLETNLIKELRPKYNVLMKDDKNYIYIKITVQEPYPRIYLVRKVLKDKARYIGPKTAAYKVIKTLKALKKVFPFRNCSMAIDYSVYGENKRSMLMTEANLHYHKAHCIGPCITSVTPQEYQKIIQQVIGFFEGKHEEIIKKIKEEMLEAASEKKFEIAAAIRDKLKAVEDVIEPQRISDPHQKDLDIINYVEQDEKIYFNLFQLRHGKLIDQENFTFKATPVNGGGEVLQTEDQDALNAFLEQYYEKATDLPKEILIPHEIDDKEPLEEWLTRMKGQKVTIAIPERGKKNHLLELSLENARSYARQSQIKWQGAERGNREKALEDLKDLLNLPSIPKRLECYDISHFGGTETVSSMTVFVHGFPKKEDYRKFHLHQQESGSPNDFASMEETLNRRLKYLKPSKALADFKVKQATKKELKIIYEKIGLTPPTEQKKGENFVEKTPDTVRHFFTVEKNKKNIGFIHVLVTPAKRHLIESFQLENPIDISLLVKKIIEKTRASRIYYRCPNSEVVHFEETGFQHIQKLPDELAPVENATYLVFDKTKYHEDASFKKIPDLIVIDGGKGQLSSALKALNKYELKIPMISLAKKEEEIYLPNNPNPISLEKSDPISLLIQHIRNEAHRFAVSYHQNLRLKATTSSILDKIPGLGPEIKNKLFRAFGSPEGIKQATMHELSGVVGHKLAMKIKKIMI